MLGLVTGGVVEQQQVKTLTLRGDEVVEEELESLRIEGRQFQEEALAGQRFDGPIQVEALEAVGRGPQGLDAAGGDTVAHERQQATATFVLRPYPTAPLTWLLGGVAPLWEVPGQCLLKLGYRFGVFFGCARRGDLGLARNLYRTRACTAL
jgi:hypothetical protein